MSSRPVSTGFPPRTPKDDVPKSSVPLSTKSESSFLPEDSPAVSPDSQDNIIYEDSASAHSSDQENRAETSNISYDYMPSRPTTMKRGNFRYTTCNSSVEYDSDFPGNTTGMSLLMMPSKNNATAVPPDPPSPKRADDDASDSPSFRATPTNLPEGYPTDLHAICAKVNASAEKLRAILLVSQGTPDVTTVDDNGRLPLHVLGNNELLISYFIKQSKPASCAKFNGLPPMELDDFVLDLVKSYPKGCIMTDSEGQIPLTKCLRDWVTLASKGILPIDGDAENEETLDQLMTSERRNDTSNRNQAVEGMERVVEDEASSRQKQSRRQQTDDETVGSRSIWTNLTNLSLPSAFKSVYSTSVVDDYGATTRALYRNHVSFSSIEDQTDLDEPNMKPVHRRTKKKPDNAAAPQQEPSPVVSPAGTRPSMFFAHDNVSLGSFSSAPDGASFDDVFPEDIPVPPVVEWCLKMLSAIVEHFENGAEASNEQDEDGTVLGTWHAQQRSRERQGTPGADTNVFHGDRNSSEGIARTIVSAVSSIPSLMKTLLLLEDSDPAKQRLFNLTIVKRMIYNPHTIGNWLVYMLEAIDGDVAERGVQFLEMLSTNPETSDYYGGTTVKGFPNKGVPTSEQRLRLYKKVSRLDYLLPAVLALEDVNMVDRVAKTHLMRHIQDRELVQRQTLVMAFFDFWFHITLLVSFTIATNFFLEGGEYGNRYLVTFYFSLVCAIFRVAWKLAQMASMIKISRSAFVANNFRVGDLLIDWLSIGMVIGGLLWMELLIDDKDEGVEDVVDDRYIRGYLAVTIGMLWASVLRWFYIINWGVTTFIDMLRQVLKDCKVFFFILTITILSFANMMYIILYDKDGQCEDDGFCNKKDVYLEIYSIVLGQFDLEDFTTTFSVVLFVIFTVFSTMVLFYVLIAVVVESHSKFTTARFSTARPEHGSRARLVYVAHLRAFRRMIEGEWTLMQYVSAILFFSASLLIMVLFLREIRDHFDDFYGDTLVILIFVALVVFTFFGILAFVSHMTYFDLTESRTSERTMCSRLFGCCLVRWISWPCSALMRWILDVPADQGSNERQKSTPTPKKMDPQAIVETWGGSAAHIHKDVKRMIESSQDQTKMVFMEELTAMEGRMRHMSDRAKAHLLMEVSSSQKRLEKMVAELQSVLMNCVYEPEDGDGQKQIRDEPSPADASKNSTNRSRQGLIEQTARARNSSELPPTGRVRPDLETIQNDSVASAPQQSSVNPDWSVDGVEGYQY